jgi:serine/threonine-protein kinase RsbW
MKQMRQPAILASLKPLLEFVSDAAADAGFGPQRRYRIQLAAEEALVNIFNYAYPDRADGEVIVRCETGPEGLQVVFVDTGTPFDITVQKAPDLQADMDARGIGGLGIHFIRTLSDDLQYRREDEENQLTLVFRK